MKQIWAPWRKRYVIGKKQNACIFCRAQSAPPKKDPKNFVLRRSRHAFILLNIYPYNNGHLMISPNRHRPGFDGLKEAEQLDLLKMLNLSVRVLKKAFRPQGFNIGVNLGRVGGAGFPKHLHIHVVPRWEGDTNFMPVVTGTKVISDSLQDVCQTLRRLFNP